MTEVQKIVLARMEGGGVESRLKLEKLDLKK